MSIHGAEKQINKKFFSFQLLQHEFLLLFFALADFKLSVFGVFGHLET